MDYRIRIQRHLDPSWQDRFGGLHIEQQERRKVWQLKKTRKTRKPQSKG